MNDVSIDPRNDSHSSVKIQNFLNYNDFEFGIVNYKFRRLQLLHAFLSAFNELECIFITVKQYTLFITKFF